MVTFLFTAIVLLAFVLVALYFWQKPPSRPEIEGLDHSPYSLPPGESHRLFEGVQEQESSVERLAAAQHEELVNRAAGGDHTAAAEAHKNFDPRLYDAILTALVKQIESDANLLSLLTYITRNELPVNSALAHATIDSWKRSPDRGSTSRTMHITALADDARLYQETVETVLVAWRTGLLTDITPAELRALFDGEFWVLSNTTRNSGAGFILKRALAKARRELESAMRVNQ